MRVGREKKTKHKKNVNTTENRLPTRHDQNIYYTSYILQRKIFYLKRVKRFP